MEPKYGSFDNYKEVQMDLIEDIIKRTFRDEWLVAALPLTQEQVTAWRKHGQPLPEETWENLQDLNNRKGNNMSKEITSDDPLMCTYDKTLDCIADRVESKTGTNRSFRLRMPFAWIDYCNSQTQSVQAR